MIKDLGRWLFGIYAIRKTAFVVLILFPSLRRSLRIYVGVEGGMGLSSHEAMELAKADGWLGPRPAQIYGDLASRVKKGSR